MKNLNKLPQKTTQSRYSYTEPSLQNCATSDTVTTTTNTTSDPTTTITLTSTHIFNK